MEYYSIRGGGGGGVPNCCFFFTYLSYNYCFPPQGKAGEKKLNHLLCLNVQGAKIKYTEKQDKAEMSYNIISETAWYLDKGSSKAFTVNMKVLNSEVN